MQPRAFRRSLHASTRSQTCTRPNDPQNSQSDRHRLSQRLTQTLPLLLLHARDTGSGSCIRWERCVVRERECSGRGTRFVRRRSSLLLFSRFVFSSSFFHRWGPGGLPEAVRTEPAGNPKLRTRTCPSATDCKQMPCSHNDCASPPPKAGHFMNHPELRLIVRWTSRKSIHDYHANHTNGCHECHHRTSFHATPINFVSAWSLLTHPLTDG